MFNVIKIRVYLLKDQEVCSLKSETGYITKMIGTLFRLTFPDENI